MSTLQESAPNQRDDHLDGEENRDEDVDREGSDVEGEGGDDVDGQAK